MSDDMNPDLGLDDGGSAEPAVSATEAGDAVFEPSSDGAEDYLSAVENSLFDGDAHPGADAESTDPASGEDEPTSVTMSFDGSSYDAGTANLDSDGDGVADTAVQDHGYQVEYYVDSDGDGAADELTVTDADGTLISHTEEVDGSWEATPGPDTASGDVTTSDDADGTEQDVQALDKFQGQDGNGPDTPSDTGPDGLHSAMGDDSSDGEPSGQTSASDQAEQTTEPVSDDAASSDATTTDMTVSIDGEDIVVGEPTLDITGDGVADTVVVESEGNVEYYVDTDQDGVADQIIVLDENDGTLVNHEVYDTETGTWTNVTEESGAHS